jgi:acetoin utilization deacetylase AcuC-like enzyme
MKKTAVVFTPKYLNHKTRLGHPESTARLRIIMRELKRSGLLETGKCSLVEPEAASIKEVELVHESDYIQLVKRVCASGGGLLDLGDTVVSPESFEVALFAAGGALKAVDLVMAGKFRNAFALVRPPGHHAGPYYALGFCIFNNAAIATAHLLRDFSLDRVLILDVDAHHGNGTQEIFYGNNKVLYISLHEDPTDFPGTGFADEVGERKGLGYTVNVPFPFRIDDQIYLEAFNQIVVPIVQQYKPQFIVVSTGFDNHYSDPVASLSLSALSYVEIFGKVLELASKFCMRRFVAVLEGGYSRSFLGRMTVAVIAKMAGIPYPLKDNQPMASPKIQRRAKKIIEEVKSIQSSFWNL